MHVVPGELLLNNSISSTQRPENKDTLGKITKRASVAGTFINQSEHVRSHSHSNRNVAYTVKAGNS